MLKSQIHEAAKIVKDIEAMYTESVNVFAIYPEITDVYVTRQRKRFIEAYGLFEELVGLYNQKYGTSHAPEYFLREVQQ